MVIAYLTMIVSLWSCVKDDFEDNSSKVKDSKMQIMLRLPGADEATRATESGSPTENQINSVHLFLFDQSGNKEFDIYMDLPYGNSSPDVDMSLWVQEKVIIVLNADILSKLQATHNIHVVANVPQEKLASVANEALLKAALTDIITGEIRQPGEGHSLVMHGVCQRHSFATNSRATLSLVRNVAKVRLTVNTIHSTANANQILFAPEGHIAVTAVDVADRSFLVEGVNHNPTGTEYISYPESIVSYFTTESETKSFVLSGFYINENLGNPKNEAATEFTYTPTYLLIQIPYNNETGMITDNYYKIEINEENGSLINRNTIYNMTVNIKSLGGETPQTAPKITAALQVLPWNEKTLVSDLTQTYISVESTSLQVAGGVFNFQYATNVEVSNRIVESSEMSWLTVSLDPQNDNNLKITASGEGYTAAREATFSIEVNNLVKVIKVRQESVPVSDGSISVSPNEVILSPSYPTRTIDLTVADSAPWSILTNSSDIATIAPESGTGSTTIKFTRGGTMGNALFRFMNLNSLAYADVNVYNLSLISSITELNIPGAGVTNVTEVGIDAFGGDEKWIVKSKPDWMTISNMNGDMVYSAEQEAAEQGRSGTIVLCHSNDEDLTVEIEVNQSAFYIMFPAYDFMVISVTWNKSVFPGLILDTIIDLSGTGVSEIDNKPVGYGFRPDGISRSYKELCFLEWAGDGATGGSMSYLVNMENLCNKYIYDELPRYYDVNIYSTWWSVPENFKKVDVSVSIKLYKGGKMIITAYNHINEDGIEVYNETSPGFIVSSAGHHLEYIEKCTLLGSITYDKFKNTATFVRKSVQK